MYIDTHAHLNFKAFANDYPQAIERANDAGVGKIIVVGSDWKTSQKAVQIANDYENVYAAVGLHPIHVKDESFDEAKFLLLAANKKVVAIGETGLDYYYDRSSAEIQKEVFRKFIKIAIQKNLPVILHSRDAAEDILPILMAENPMPRGVMHCFSEDWQFAKIILEMGFYISFTGLITFTKNQETFETIKNAPLERILIETDCPYMTPAFATHFVKTSRVKKATAGKPDLNRGKRNEPAYVIEVAKKISELRKVPVEEVAKATTQNALELFRF